MYLKVGGMASFGLGRGGAGGRRRWCPKATPLRLPPARGEGLKATPSSSPCEGEGLGHGVRIRMVSICPKGADGGEGSLDAAVSAGLEDKVHRFDVADFAHGPNGVVGGHFCAHPLGPEDSRQADVGDGLTLGCIGENLGEEIGYDLAGFGVVEADGGSNSLFVVIPGSVREGDAGQVAEGGMIVPSAPPAQIDPAINPLL